MFKNFFFRSLLKSKIKSLPEDQQNKILNLVEKNPDFFTSLAKKIEERVQKGEGQESAAFAVMHEYQSEIQQMMR